MKHAQTACETFGFLFLSENRDASLDMPESVAEAGQLIRIAREFLPLPGDAEQILLILGHPHGDVVAA